MVGLGFMAYCSDDVVLCCVVLLVVVGEQMGWDGMNMVFFLAV